MATKKRRRGKGLGTVHRRGQLWSIARVQKRRQAVRAMGPRTPIVLGLHDLLMAWQVTWWTRVPATARNAEQGGVRPTRARTFVRSMRGSCPRRT